jgi:hypothetical protein
MVRRMRNSLRRGSRLWPFAIAAGGTFLAMFAADLVVDTHFPPITGSNAKARAWSSNVLAVVGMVGGG